LEETNFKKVIILTHHAPLFSDVKKQQYTASPQYVLSKNNFAFHNKLNSLIKKPIVAWIYGHTHYASKFILNDAIIATNQLGYKDESSYINYDPHNNINLSLFV